MLTGSAKIFSLFHAEEEPYAFRKVITYDDAHINYMSLYMASV